MQSNKGKTYLYVADKGETVIEFPQFETPFNLAGELIDNSTTEEGEARVRALAEAEARKAQMTFDEPLDKGPLEGELFIRDSSMFECGGTFDGFTCGSDADPGL